MSPLSSARLLTIALLSALAIACGDDDDSAPSGQGGAGSSGTSGQGGAGSSGSAGQPGTAGTSSDGGAAGTTPAGAAGASGGSAGSTTAGSGGASAGASGSDDGTAGTSAGAAGEGGSAGSAGGNTAGAGGGAGSSGASGYGGSASSSVQVLYDVQIPRKGGGMWPHKIDIYGPSNATRALVLLHGGGGFKEQIPKNLGIVLDDKTINEGWLTQNQLMVVVPQGQKVDADGVATWQNRVMISGQDDVAFLTELGALLRAGQLQGQPAVSRLYLSGHSNGGMMTNRMWCEAPAVFDAYAAMAGPASKAFDPDIHTAPCAPSPVRPYLGFVGSADKVLRTVNNWDKNYWTITPTLTTNKPSWDDPDMVNEERFHTLVRLPLVCGGSATAPVDSSDSSMTTWTGCEGRVRLVRINGSDHPISDMEEKSGLVLRDELATFFKGTESVQ